MFGSEDIMKYEDILDYEWDVVGLGHWHIDQGIYESPTGKKILNVGSLTRGSLSYDNLSRTPCCVVLRFDESGVQAERVPLKVKPHEEVFDIEGKVKKEAQEMVADEFLSKMEKALSHTDHKIPLTDIVRDLPDLNDKVREKAIQILERFG